MNISLKEDAPRLKEVLGSVGEESATFGKYKLRIMYDEDIPNPFKENDQPEGSGIDLSNHRDYRGDEFGEKAPVKVPEFLYWKSKEEPGPSEYFNYYRCSRYATCGHEWEDYGETWREKQACPECENRGETTYPRNPYKSEAHDEDWDAFNAFEKDYYWLPVYLYDHSGRTVNTTGFDCPWDSGCAGVVFIPKAELVRGGYWGAKKSMTLARKQECAEKFLTAHVAELDMYMRGDVYCYSTSARKGYWEEECVDSCGGFWGEAGRAEAVELMLSALQERIETEKE